MQAMVSPPGTLHRATYVWHNTLADHHHLESAPATPLLDALTASHVAPLHLNAVTSTHTACLLFSHLLRASTHAKTLARSIVPPGAQLERGGNFYVPADGAPPPPPPEEEPEQEEPQTLLQILSEHLSLAFLARGRVDTSEREAREWDRLLAGYLTLLSQWLWEDPQAVRQFLEAGALGIVSSAMGIAVGEKLISRAARRADQPDVGDGHARACPLGLLARNLLRVQQRAWGDNEARIPLCNSCQALTPAVGQVDDTPDPHAPRRRHARGARHPTAGGRALQGDRPRHARARTTQRAGAPPGWACGKARA